eukprot:562489-Pyramimonas_sp.AAC.1
MLYLQRSGCVEDGPSHQEEAQVGLAEVALPALGIGVPTAGGGPDVRAHSMTTFHCAHVVCC